MDDSIRKNLEAAKKRINEIDKELLRDDITNDLNYFKEISKERAQLEPIVEKFDEFLTCESNREDAYVMTNDEEPWCLWTGKMEYKELGERMDALIDEIKINARSRWSYDDKNIVVEIRGAVVRWSQYLRRWPF